jgi:hypothetical protein
LTGESLRKKKKILEENALAVFGDISCNAVVRLFDIIYSGWKHV